MRLKQLQSPMRIWLNTPNCDLPGSWHIEFVPDWTGLGEIEYEIPEIPDYSKQVIVRGRVHKMPYGDSWGRGWWQEPTTFPHKKVGDILDDWKSHDLHEDWLAHPGYWVIHNNSCHVMGCEISDEAERVKAFCCRDGYGKGPYKTPYEAIIGAFYWDKKWIEEQDRRREKRLARDKETSIHDEQRLKKDQIAEVGLSQPEAQKLTPQTPLGIGEQGVLF